MKRYLMATLALAFFAACSGCAGLIEFRTPKEFKDGKLIEDPPL
jgi:hypothetical protein